MDNKAKSDLRSAVMKGAAWSVALRWTIRLLGLLSTVILARLLAPADFGLVAMAMLVVAFLESWLQLGLGMALIQNQYATRAHYDTAWTLRILQSVVVAGIIAAGAPLAATYFAEPRVVPVLWALSPALVLGGFANIGVVAFQKELEFHKVFSLGIAAKLLGIVITLGAAFLLRSYWALVIGVIAGYGVGCALSYAMHPYRPRFSLAKVRELWSYSQWMLIRGVGHFLDMRSDEILVGGLGSTRQLGLYSVAAELGTLPGSEVAAPLNQALMPGFAKIQHDPHRLAAAYLNVLGAVSALTFPAGVGLALVSYEAVVVLLGDQWTDAAPLLAILAVFGGVRASNSLAVGLFLGSGRVAMAAGVSWLNAGLLVAIALPLIGGYGVIGVASARLAGGVLMAILILGAMARLTEVRIKGVIARLWRIVAASCLMAVTVTSVPEIGSGIAVDLIAKVLVGVLTYCAALLLLWRFSGYPEGAERFFLDHLRGLVR
jgi:O-antigen/teichoic acid export membrane protein